jgi:hypothetical protein
MVYLARPDGLEWSMCRTHGMCNLPRYLQCTMAQGAMVILAINTIGSATQVMLSFARYYSDR